MVETKKSIMTRSLRMWHAEKGAPLIQNDSTKLCPPPVTFIHQYVVGTEVTQEDP